MAFSGMTSTNGSLGISPFSILLPAPHTATSFPHYLDKSQAPFFVLKTLFMSLNPYFPPQTSIFVPSPYFSPKTANFFLLKPLIISLKLLFVPRPLFLSPKPYISPQSSPSAPFFVRKPLFSPRAPCARAGRWPYLRPRIPRGGVPALPPRPGRAARGSRCRGEGGGGGEGGRAGGHFVAAPPGGAGRARAAMAERGRGEGTRDSDRDRFGGGQKGLERLTGRRSSRSCCAPISPL